MGKKILMRSRASNSIPRKLSPCDKVDVHTFVGDVGGNPDGLYVVLRCQCGHEYNARRSELKRKESTEGCVRCAHKRRSEKGRAA